MNMMEKVSIIIQARSGSSRLSQKAFAEVCGKPLLWHVIERAKLSKRISDIIVATTTRSEDRAILELAKSCNVHAYAGSEEDVLQRYYEAALKNGADVIVRMTGDCPLIHPPTVDAMIALLQEKKADYVCPDPRHRSLETGLEVFTMKTLREMHEKAVENYQREHVTLYLREHPESFKIALHIPDQIFQRKDIRITVDYLEDLELIRIIYRELYREGEIIDLKKVVEFLDQHPEFKDLNIHAKLSKANQLSISDAVSEKIIRSVEKKKNG
ncbi:uncharacterized protein MJ1063 [Waddlia chondrophila 2032/99]|uniref:Uncharacterized protein MJ1063 n=1 Tax=Waddlia chondrophila 2032/99 TaxID=765953 RepID=F8LDG3_9BACT|nr:uncharacterized protein MJ1063 [Waddlia chondrophila 2032/99]